MKGQRTIGKRQDRLMAFFDAILAIAMTVLALELTVPQLSIAKYAERYDFFVSVTCYLISFVALSTLWYIHNNFFSTHDLTGNNLEIVLHLVLLFFITLFQPLTKAIGQHPTDSWIRALYLIDFLATYGLMAIIFVVISRRENKISERKSARMSNAKEKRENYQISADDVSDEVKNLQHILQIVYAIENPEEIQKRLADYAPDEYKEEFAEYKKKQETIYRMSLYSVFTMAIAVFLAVIALMFSIWLSYLALACGLLVIFLIRAKRNV